MRNAGSPGNSGVGSGSFTWLRNPARPNAGRGTAARPAPVAVRSTAAEVTAPATNRTSPEAEARILRLDFDIAPSFARRHRAEISGRYRRAAERASRDGPVR